MTPSEGPVSRETAPPAPNAASLLFGERLSVATAYADLLTDSGVTRGLLGPREAPRIWTRHLLNCAVLGEVLPPAADVCDIGSGAGLPGVVLAICRPDVQVTVVEPLLRRTDFLSEVVGRLGLDNVEVVRARAEDLHGAHSFGVVTSRALAPLPRLLAWSVPLVRAPGTVLAIKGSSAATELSEAAATVGRVGGEADVLSLGAERLDPPTTVIRVEVRRLSPLR